MKTIQKIEVYPLGVIKRNYEFVDLFTIRNKKWELICTVNNLNKKFSLDKEELDITEECIIYHDEYPDIYIYDKNLVIACKKALKMLSEKTKKQYILIKKNIVDLN